MYNILAKVNCQKSCPYKVVVEIDYMGQFHQSFYMLQVTKAHKSGQAAFCVLGFVHVKAGHKHVDEIDPSRKI